MSDDWELSEEDYARLEREAWLQVSQKKASDMHIKEQVPKAPVPVHDKASRPSNVKPSSGKQFVVHVFKISSHHIATRSSYNQGLKDALKAVEGSVWDKEARCWKFPESNLKRVIQVIRNLPDLHAEAQLSPELLSSPFLRDQQQINGSQPPLNQWSAVEGEIDHERHAAPSAAKESFQTSCAPGFSVAGQQLQEGRPMADLREPSSHDQPFSQHEGLCPPSRAAQPSRPQAFPELRILKLKPSADGRISVTFREHQGLTEFLGLLEGAKQEEVKRQKGTVCWTLPLKMMPNLKACNASIPSLKLQIEELQPLVLRVLQDFSRLQDEGGRLESLPCDLKSALMPFQEEGVLFGLKRGGRMLCADEMGLGKTLQAIGLAACFREEWPVLVIVPSSLRLHWAMSVSRWLKIPPYDITVLVANSSCATSREGFVFTRCSKDTTVELKGLFNVVSYELIDRVANDFQIVIADESHYLKNYKAKRTALCCPKLQKARRAILLTGTPALARPIDLYKQLEALQPLAYKSLKEYGERYCQGGFFGQYNGSSNMDELHNLMSSTIMIRRLKRDVLPQLPPKHRQQIVLMLAEKSMAPIKRTMKQLREVQKVVKACLSGGGDDAVAARLQEQNLIAQLYHETAEAKLESVKEFLSTLLEERTKFLVFAHHQVMIQAIEKLMMEDSSKPAYIKIDGSTPHEKRQQLVETFQKDSNVTVAILAIRAAGVGLTLTEASTVVFAELAWNPGEIVQAEDRAHRIGQEKSVSVYYLHAPDTADDMLWTAVQHKLDVTGKALDGQEKGSWSLQRARHGAEEGGAQVGGAATKGQTKLEFPVVSKPPQVSLEHNKAPQAQSLPPHTASQQLSTALPSVVSGEDLHAQEVHMPLDHQHGPKGQTQTTLGSLSAGVVGAHEGHTSLNDRAMDVLQQFGVLEEEQQLPHEPDGQHFVAGLHASEMESCATASCLAPASTSTTAGPAGSNHMHATLAPCSSLQHEHSNAPAFEQGRPSIGRTEGENNQRLKDCGEGSQIMWGESCKRKRSAWSAR